MTTMLKAAPVLTELDDTPDDSPGETATSPERSPDHGTTDPSLLAFARSLDLDAVLDEDLLWVAQEAFNAKLPAGWTEYTSEQGQLYYCRQEFGETTWEHPMDHVYRELVQLVKRTRAESLNAEQRMAAITDHLKQVHDVALKSLAGWSGPYATEQGEYYHNDALRVSTWENPVAEWEMQLQLRYNILARCLLSSSPGDTTPGSALLKSLRLPLELCCKDDVPQPSTRSYQTARSAQSTARQSARSERGKDRQLSQSPPGHKRHQRSIASKDTPDSVAQMDKALPNCP
eukprot:CAMPEP_0178410414 /NCGR_PEP_ID=MMETSP0689_2-20121128/20967_1 /TAXON_ID=160604 /ORGANISM="Amphidinium massartii, Strain CS-259" /LENGTH=287 /DNA_ID=CAMNT_0020031589 /DNA_START=33 /DNA_END=892 /DNA_ORIENTATION=-